MFLLAKFIDGSFTWKFSRKPFHNLRIKCNKTKLYTFQNECRLKIPLLKFWGQFVNLASLHNSRPWRRHGSPLTHTHTGAYDGVQRFLSYKKSYTLSRVYYYFGFYCLFFYSVAFTYSRACLHCNNTTHRGSDRRNRGKLERRQRFDVGPRDAITIINTAPSEW